MTKPIRAIVTVLVTLLSETQSDVLSGLGSALSIGTGLLPPEMRGIAGSVANAALAKQNKERGIIEVAPDGSDYPWICLCATKTQVEGLAKQGTKIDPKKCPEDQEMGCKPPQVNMDNAPLPVPSQKTSKSR